MKFTKEELAFIRENIKIEDEISKHVVLRKESSEYVGHCPFHNDNKENLKVNPRKQVFGCFVCGYSGDIFKFIQTLLHLSFKSAVTYLILNNGSLHQKYGLHGKGNVYVLRLIGDKFYVGYTEHYCNRMNSHFSGAGAEWTKENVPVEIYGIYNDVNEEFENELTKIYIERYGYQNVRGGNYAFRKIKYEEVRKDLNNKTYEGVFILLLEENKYFIDYAINLKGEIQRHFNGEGCEWTKKYKPMKTLKIIRTRNQEETKKVTFEYIEKYGWDNVRGYRWKKVDLKMPD